MTDTSAGPSDSEDAGRGGDEWKSQTKAIERVIDVALTVQSPQTADRIADEALVSPQTARDHLDLLADELGVIAKTTVSGVTKYRPDAAYLRYREVSRLVEEYTRDELVEMVEGARQRIEAVKSKYGVESPDELRSKAASDDTPVEDIREYRTVASEWDTIRHDLTVYREALERYAEFDRASGFDF